MAASLSVERSSSCGGGGGVFCRFVLFSSFIDPVRCADDQSSAVLWAGVFSLLEPSHSLDRSNVQGLRPLLGCIKCSVPRRFTPSQSRSFTVTFPNSSAPQCVWSVCFTLYIRCCLSFAFVLLVLSVSACAETSLTPSWGLLLERRPSQPSFFFCRSRHQYASFALHTSSNPVLVLIVSPHDWACTVAVFYASSVARGRRVSPPTISIVCQPASLTCAVFVCCHPERHHSPSRAGVFAAASFNVGRRPCLCCRRPHALSIAAALSRSAPSITVHHYTVYAPSSSLLLP